MALRILVKALIGSSKNIMPKREYTRFARRGSKA